MIQAKKLDLVAEHKTEYATPKRPQLVRTAPGRYLTIEGAGEPAGPEFQDKIGAIYGVAYTIKFATKGRGGPDFKIPPLESLWWAPDRDEAVPRVPSPEWRWKLLVRVPDFVGGADLDAAREELTRKGKAGATADVRIEVVDEGDCVQMLHIGPYADEERTVSAMEAFAKENGLEVRGPHHEIYLSDPRRTKPDRLRTILRHPVGARSG